MKDLESKELTQIDLKLLRSWHMNSESPGARKLVLVGRLQCKLGVLVVDGKWGPQTATALKKQEPALGPELSHIIREEWRRLQETRR